MNARIPDRSEFTDWIGRTSERRNTLTLRQAAEFETTLARRLAQVDGAPFCIYRPLAPDATPMSDLGGDGHPRPGLLAPKPPLRATCGWAANA